MKKLFKAIVRDPFVHECQPGYDDAYHPSFPDALAEHAEYVVKATENTAADTINVQESGETSTTALTAVNSPKENVSSTLPEYLAVRNGDISIVPASSSGGKALADYPAIVGAAENALRGILLAAESSLSSSVESETCKQSRSNSLEFRLATSVIGFLHIKMVNGQLYLYNGIYYLLISREELRQEVLAYYLSVYSDDPPINLIEKTARYIPMFKTIVLNNVIFDTSRIAFQNGIYNVDVGMAELPSPERLIFRHVEANLAPHLQGQCPEFKRYLYISACGNVALIERVWEFLAYVLVDRKLKNFVILLGPKDCGKSVMIKLLESFYSFADIISLQPHDLAKEFSLSGVDGKKLCICGDLPSDVVSGKAVGLLKSITGGDSIGGRHLYSEQKILNTTGLRFVFGSNHPLCISNTDDAFDSRLIYIVFPASIPRSEQDPELLEKLIAEKDAIINTALAYIPQVLMNNGITAGEAETQALLESLYGNYGISAEESIERFFNACCDISQGNFVETTVLYDRYCGFMNGSPLFMNCSAFSKAFKAYLIKDNVPFSDTDRPYADKDPVTGKARRLRGYTGITLLC